MPPATAVGSDDAKLLVHAGAQLLARVLQQWMGGVVHRWVVGRACLASVPTHHPERNDAVGLLAWLGIQATQWANLSHHHTTLPWLRRSRGERPAPLGPQQMPPHLGITQKHLGIIANKHRVFCACCKKYKWRDRCQVVLRHRLVGLACTACSDTTAHSISWCKLPTCIASSHGSLHDNDLLAAGEGRMQDV